MIAKNVSTNKETPFNLEKLVTTRLLIQANSGGGKSYAIRKLIEETNGSIQQIIIDLEGEFSSLREEYNHILIGTGRGADVQISLQISELLAKKLMKLKADAIIDLSELKKHERILFVKRFLNQLVESPKKYWHPVLVILDEVHQFCSQTTKTESTSAVIDLMTRGRKRGLCGVIATQRISKLNKDAAAEANNKLIGRTSLDIDMKRAGDELGFTNREDIASLRDLKPGEFFAFGPAFTNNITKVKIQPVKTTHEPNTSEYVVTKPNDKIKDILGQLSDLPKEVVQELKDLTDYKLKIRDLEQQLRNNKPFDNGKLENLILSERVQQASLKERNMLIKLKNESLEKQTAVIEELSSKNTIKDSWIAQIVSEGQNILKGKKLLKRFSQHLTIPDKDSPIGSEIKEYIEENFKVKKPVVSIPPDKPIFQDKHYIVSDGEELGLCAKKIYGFLATNPERGFTKVQIGVMTGYSPKSGSFSNALSRLNSLGLLIKNGSELSICTPVNSELYTVGETYSIDLIKNKIAKCPREIFELLLLNPDIEYSKAELAYNTQSQYSPTSGSYSNAISKLNGLGLITKNDGLIKLNSEVKEMM